MTKNDFGYIIVGFVIFFSCFLACMFWFWFMTDITSNVVNDKDYLDYLCAVNHKYK